MTGQLGSIAGVLRAPKQTLRALPSDRLWALSIVSPLYFGIARAFRPRQYEIFANWLGGTTQVVLFAAALSLVMLPVGGWLVKHFLHLFKKRLTITKILNINGYASVPKIIVAILANALVFLKPGLLTDEPISISGKVLIVTGILGMGYTVFLGIYGIVVSDSEQQEMPNQAL